MNELAFFTLSDYKGLKGIKISNGLKLVYNENSCSCDQKCIFVHCRKVEIFNVSLFCFKICSACLFRAEVC